MNCGGEWVTLATGEHVRAMLLNDGLHAGQIRYVDRAGHADDDPALIVAKVLASQPAAAAAARMVMTVDWGAVAVRVTIIGSSLDGLAVAAAIAGNKKDRGLYLGPRRCLLVVWTLSGSPPPVPPAAPGERSKKRRSRTSGAEAGPRSRDISLCFPALLCMGAR